MNLLLIMVRGLRASSLGCYGNDWIPTPTINQLAAQGIVFDHCIADHPHSPGQLPTWRSGFYQFPEKTESADPQSFPDLLETFQRHKISSVLIKSSRKNRDPAILSIAEKGWMRVVTPAPGANQTTTQAILKSLDEELTNFSSPGKELLCIELDDLLPPWEISEEYLDLYFGAAPEDQEIAEPLLPGEVAPAPLPVSEPVFEPQTGFLDPDDYQSFLNLQETYGAAVSQLDAVLGEILARLDQRKLRSHTAIVLVSDWGQSLGDHGLVGDSKPWLHEEVVHLPLIIALPGNSFSGLRISALVQPVDLAPTLSELMGVSFPQSQGFDLRPLWEENVTRVRDYACSGNRVGDRVEWSLRTADWALLMPIPAHEEHQERTVQLYVKPEDRWEINDVRHHQIEVSESLETTLEAFVGATQQKPPFSPPSLVSSASSAPAKANET